MENHTHSKSAIDWKAGHGANSQESSDFFQTERQIGKIVEMVSFSLKTGVKRAFPVLAFDEIRFKPEMGIFLHSRSITITIVGRNLDALYQFLVLRRVKQVIEFSEKEEAENELWIESIRIFSDYDEH